MDDITLGSQQLSCASPTCASEHPHIAAYMLSIKLKQTRSIGYIKCYTFSKAAMDLAHPNSFWEQSQAFDENHSGAKLDKIENFLANESFYDLAEERIAAADIVLFIDQVWLEVECRRRGYDLVAVKRAIEALRPMNSKVLVMLQAGDVGGGGGDAHEASEKLTAYWGRLGFSPWSDSDEAWLLLWLKEGETL